MIDDGAPRTPAKTGQPIDPPQSLIERVIFLRTQAASEREAGYIGREGDLWEGHRAATDAAAAMVQQAINRVGRLQPREAHSSSCIDVKDVLAILGAPTTEQPL